MSINYFCSGFNPQNAFFPQLAEQLKKDLTGTTRIVYIPGSNKKEKIERTINEKIPAFTEHFQRIGITFEHIDCITPDTDKEQAKYLVNNSNMIILMGGNPFLQQELYQSKDLTQLLKNYHGVMLGFSAGAMNMSKYIIITPCSEEYPNFDIRPALNLANISISPHYNFKGNIMPDKIYMGSEITLAQDLLKVANEYGNFYCLQDYTREDGLTNVSLIRTHDNQIDIIRENAGKVWEVTPEGFNLVKKL